MSNRLKEKQRELEVELSEQFSEISDTAKDVGKQAIIIAGGVFVAYQLVKFMSSSKKKKKKKKTLDKVYRRLPASAVDENGNSRIIIQEAPSPQTSSFLSEMKAEFGAMIMELVKAKLYDVLENLNNNTQQSDEETEHS